MSIQLINANKTRLAIPNHQINQLIDHAIKQAQLNISIPPPKIPWYDDPASDTDC